MDGSKGGKDVNAPLAVVIRGDVTVTECSVRGDTSSPGKPQYLAYCSEQKCVGGCTAKLTNVVEIPEGLLVLTPRERQVVVRLGQGLTANEIAKALFISRHTVETHLYNSRRKLQLRHLPALTSWAATHQFVLQQSVDGVLADR